MAYERTIVDVIESRINEPRRFIQIVMGPRQTGKTTAASQALSRFAHPFRSVEAYNASCWSTPAHRSWSSGRSTARWKTSS